MIIAVIKKIGFKVLSLCYNRDMKRKIRGGFTLIELALSLVFIAILSLTVVLLIQNTTASYRRGLILNQINTVGMDLIDDFRTSVQYSTSDSVVRMCEILYSNDENGPANQEKCENDNADSFVSVTKKARVTANGINDVEMPVFGAFCTGTYTYVWNSGYFEDTDTDDRAVSITSGTVPGTDGSAFIDYLDNNGEYKNVANNFRLVKIYDDERSICRNAMNNQASSGYTPLNDYANDRISNRFLISEAMLNDEGTYDNVLELLKKNEASDLVLYNLYVAKPAISATRKNLFYAGSFVLGTRRGGININAVGNSCKPPSDDFSDLDYCAVNKFNFAVTAGGN